MIDFIRIKTDEQLDCFAKLASTIWHEYFTCIISNEQIDYMIDKFQSKKAIAQQLKDGYQYYFVSVDGEICGYTGFCKKEDYLFLSKLYMKKECRGQGTGRKTLEFIEEYAKKHCMNKIQLTVNKYNLSTIAAYDKWGFEIIADKMFDIGGGFFMDDYVMQKTL